MSLAGAALLACAAPMAAALEFETLFEHRDWRVDVNLWPDGSMDCEALTYSGGNGAFSIFEMADGSMRLSFHAPNWEFPQEPTPTRFTVTVDRKAPWQMDGTRSSSTISLTTDAGRADMRRFLREVGHGERLHLSNADGRHLLSFSLAGSAASLTALGECAALLPGGQPSDPFANDSADPFR